MDHEKNTGSPESLKQIPFWTRKYAQNRGMLLFAVMVIILLIGISISVPLGLGLVAFRKGNMPLVYICLSIEVAELIGLLIFTSKFGGKNRGRLEQLINNRVYGQEGVVSLPQSQESQSKKVLELLMAIVGASLLIGTVYLGMNGFIETKYQLPISASYLIPYMIITWYFWLKPNIGRIYLIAPLLYSIHAILILAGVPAFFPGQLGAPLNVSLPLAGYSLLALLISHIYSRFALKKLKHIAGIKETSPHKA